jgi:hypothetical protein
MPYEVLPYEVLPYEVLPYEVFWNHLWDTADLTDDRVIDILGAPYTFSGGFSAFTGEGASCIQ